MSKVSIYDLYATSEEAAEDGKWFDITPDISFKVRRFKSKKSRKVREKLEAPYKRMMRNGNELPPEILEEILVAQMAEALIVDWKGITDKEGNPVPFSSGAAEQLLTDLPELRDELANISLRLENFREEDKDDILKN